MKIKKIFPALIVLLASLSISSSYADDITAIASGSWGDSNIWYDNVTLTNQVPGTNDDADIPAGFNVTVDTNAIVQYIYDYGTVTMAANSVLTIITDTSIATSLTLDTTALGNTVIYTANPFFAKECNYYNLAFVNTNFVPAPPYGNVYEDFNNWGTYGPTPMTIAGNMTLMGAVKVQQGSGGAPITIGGNLTIGAGCAWDCSGDILTVSSNVFVCGCFEDLNAALGTNYVGGGIIISGPSNSIPIYNRGFYTNGWIVSDVTSWGLGGSLTNNGSILGAGYGSISFDGGGAIAGTNAVKIPTMAINGTYAIADNVIITTNTPLLNGTLVFDLANSNMIVQQYVASTNQFPSYLNLYYGGNLMVINSGSASVAGNTYKLFRRQIMPVDLLTPLFRLSLRA